MLYGRISFSRSKTLNINGLLIVILLHLLCLLNPSFALADGKVFIESDGNWMVGDELRQEAVISRHSNKQQQLFLKIGAKTEGNPGIWVFPIPSKPADIVIDVSDKFPRLEGHSYQAHLSDAAEGLSWLFAPIYVISPSASRLFVVRALVSTFFVGDFDGITVHKATSKLGLTAQVFTARGEDSLLNYLEKRGLRLDENEKEIWAYYQQKDFTFIVASFAGDSPRPENDLALNVRFTTDRFYFPLLASKTNSDKKIPVYIQILADVEAVLPTELKDQTKVSLFFGKIDSQKEALSQLGFPVEGKTGNFAFTDVRLRAAPKDFTGDLWFVETSIWARNYRAAIYGLLSPELVAVVSLIVSYTSLILMIVILLPPSCRSFLGWGRILKYAILTLIAGLPFSTLILTREAVKETGSKQSFIHSKWLFGLVAFSAFGDFMLPILIALVWLFRPLSFYPPSHYHSDPYAPERAEALPIVFFYIIEGAIGAFLMLTLFGLSLVLLCLLFYKLHRFGAQVQVQPQNER